MCFIWKKPRLPELTTREIERFFQKSNKFSWVGLTGGEIFLRQDILEISRIILKHCKDLCVLHFPTNGFLKEQIIAQVKEMSKLKPARLFATISVDGPEETHDRLRGVSGSWRNAVETFLSLREISRVSPYISMTLSSGNHGLIHQTISAIKTVYPKFNPSKMMNFNLFQKSSHYFENTGLTSPDESQLLRDVNQAADILGSEMTFKNYLQKNYLKYCRSYLKTGHSPLPCQALSVSCLINPYGEIFPCGVYDKKIGNIKDPEFNLYDLWNKEKTTDLHHACRNGDCPGCWSPCDAYQSINASLTKKFLQLFRN